MTLLVEQRVSDSAYVETVTQGQAASARSAIRPAEYCWHMVFVRKEGSLHSLAVGPWTTAGVASWGKNAEILWLKFRPGVFMPHWSFRKLVDRESRAGRQRPERYL